MRPGLMKHQAHFLYPKQGKRLILGWMASTMYSFYNWVSKLRKSGYSLPDVSKRSEMKPAVQEWKS